MIIPVINFVGNIAIQLVAQIIVARAYPHVDKAISETWGKLPFAKKKRKVGLHTEPPPRLKRQKKNK